MNSQLHTGCLPVIPEHEVCNKPTLGWANHALLPLCTFNYSLIDLSPLFLHGISVMGVKKARRWNGRMIHMQNCDPRWKTYGCGRHGKDETQGRSHVRRGDFGTEVPAIERICLLLTEVEDCSEFKTSLSKIVSFRSPWAAELRLFFQKSWKTKKVKCDKVWW